MRPGLHPASPVGDVFERRTGQFGEIRKVFVVEKEKVNSSRRKGICDCTRIFTDAFFLLRSKRISANNLCICKSGANLREAKLIFVLDIAYGVGIYYKQKTK